MSQNAKGVFNGIVVVIFTFIRSWWRPKDHWLSPLFHLLKAKHYWNIICALFSHHIRKHDRYNTILVKSLRIEWYDFNLSNPRYFDREVLATHKLHILWSCFETNVTGIDEIKTILPHFIVLKIIVYLLAYITYSCMAAQTLISFWTFVI